MPTPGATGYALTKHAVVGLSTSLRLEAAPLGVKVSVVCPGLIDTPIKYATRLLGPDRDELLRSVPPLYPADACARDILRGVARNRAVIVVTRLARLSWAIYRLAPRRILPLMQYVANRSPLLRGGGDA